MVYRNYRELEKIVSYEIALKSIWVDIVEGGAKNSYSVTGLSMTGSPGFVTLPDLFYSGLDSIVNYKTDIVYDSNDINKLEQIALYREHEHSSYHSLYNLPSEKVTIFYHDPEDLLKSDRPKMPVENVRKVRETIKKAFKLTMHSDFPKDIVINVWKGDRADFLNLDKDVRGFAINRKGSGVSEIFFREDDFDKVIVVVAHEVSHVYTRQLKNKHSEEAKAFALGGFAILETIKKFNIANLANSLDLDFVHRPAKNGLHDVAFNWVKNLIKKGKKALELHWDLVNGYFSLEHYSY